LDGTLFGSSGTSGESGSSGSSGQSGTSGISGSAGTSGSSGFDGTFFGSSGTTGTSGTSGVSGTSGISGTTGTSGSSGFDGTFFGSSGTSGTSGVSASNGTSGTSGLGTSGTSGFDGTYFGSSGTSGASGTSGTSGAGTSGTSGISGSNGSSGTSGFLDLAGTTDNGLITWDNGNTKGQVESNITFNGSLLSITGGIESTYAGATAFRETYSDLGTGGSTSIDLSTANNFRRQFNAAATITFTSAPSGRAFGFTITTVNAGAYVIDWPVIVNWVGGSQPLLSSSGTDVLTFFTFDGGTSYYGFLVGKDMS
jgi:hypothetical protein